MEHIILGMRPTKQHVATQLTTHSKRSMSKNVHSRSTTTTSWVWLGWEGVIHDRVNNTRRGHAEGLCGRHAPVASRDEGIHIYYLCIYIHAYGRTCGTHQHEDINVGSEYLCVRARACLEEMWTLPYATVRHSYIWLFHGFVRIRFQHEWICTSGWLEDFRCEWIEMKTPSCTMNVQKTVFSGLTEMGLAESNSRSLNGWKWLELLSFTSLWSVYISIGFANILYICIYVHYICVYPDLRYETIKFIRQTCVQYSWYCCCRSWCGCSTATQRACKYHMVCHWLLRMPPSNSSTDTHSHKPQSVLCTEHRTQVYI